MKNKIIKANLLPITDIDELRQIQIELLDEVVRFCEENDITYYLAYGTLLGSVRHKGYIPWDDDIDLIMLRKDYDKFNNLYKNNDKFYKSSYDKNKGFWNSFIKFSKKDTVCIELGLIKTKSLGVNIDIFPFDYIPDNNFKMNLQFYFMKLNRGIYSIKINAISKRKSLKSNIAFALGKVLVCLYPLKAVNYVIDKTARRYDKTPTKRVENLIGINNKGCLIFDASVFDGTTDVVFEGKTYKGPKKIADFLTVRYGDYKKLPPKSEQVTHHSNDNYKIIN